MDFLPEEIEKYAREHSQQEPQILQDLNRETWQKVLAPRMLSGHLQGRILSMISKIKQPTYILEIGTYTGYSALCLAEGIQKDGQLHTIDVNEELYELQRTYFDRSGYGEKIIQHTGNAADIIPKLDHTFDLLFIDADKHNYPLYLELILDKVKSGSLIITDNVLWSGKVLKPIGEGDRDTAALVAYNKAINDHPRLETVVLPVRDGLTISRVK
jgi:predicted O-methyltransferase YrrM